MVSSRFRNRDVFTERRAHTPFNSGVVFETQTNMISYSSVLGLLGIELVYWVSMFPTDTKEDEHIE